MSGIAKFFHKKSLVKVLVLLGSGALLSVATIIFASVNNALDTPQALNEQVGGFVIESLDRGRKKYLLVKDREEAYARAQADPEGVIIRETNLEDVFIKLTGERLA